MDEARRILEEARRLQAEGRCASSIRKAQEAAKVALTSLLASLGLEPTGAVVDHMDRISRGLGEEFERALREACEGSKWITLACEARLEKSVEGPREGSCTSLDSEAAVKAAERIVELVEGVLSRPR